MAGRRHVAFETAHASVPIAYFAGTILLALFALQPVYVALSLAGALAYSLACRGLRATALKLRWQLPMLAIVALANPLFSAQGCGSRTRRPPSQARACCRSSAPACPWSRPWS